MTGARGTEPKTTYADAAEHLLEEAEYLMWKLVLVSVGLLIVGCAAVESAAGYLGELYGYYRCRQECPFHDECSCTPPSEKPSKNK